MKVKALIFFLAFFSTNVNLIDIRSLYSQVTISKDKQSDFISYMENVESKTAVIQAYKGAALILQSKSTAKNRKQIFTAGAKLIEESISKEPNNIEIRLIRLSIQENIPKALKYNANIQEDVSFIQKHKNAIKDSELKSYVNQYVELSRSFK